MSDVFGTVFSRQAFVVTFLAILEMARLGRVHLVQEVLFGDVRLSR